jgi:hypothetical protein
VLPSAGTLNIYELSAREKESTKKEKRSKKEIKIFSYNKRMFNKKKVNSFRIIVTTKMAEIFELKISGNFFLFFLFFGISTNFIENELYFD